MAGAAAAPIDPLEVLRWPGVIRDVERDVTPLAAAAIELLRETAGELNAARAAKAHAFARCWCSAASRCATRLRRCGRGCRGRRPHQGPRDRARGPARHLGDAERLEQEVALLAYKMDVEEELDRLGSHIAETLQVLDSTEPAGRRLDFLMQEFNARPIRSPRSRRTPRPRAPPWT